MSGPQSGNSNSKDPYPKDTQEMALENSIPQLTSLENYVIQIRRVAKRAKTSGLFELRIRHPFCYYEAHHQIPPVLAFS